MQLREAGAGEEQSHRVSISIRRGPKALSSTSGTSEEEPHACGLGKHVADSLRHTHFREAHWGNAPVYVLFEVTGIVNIKIDE